MPREPTAALEKFGVRCGCVFGKVVAYQQMKQKKKGKSFTGLCKSFADMIIVVHGLQLAEHEQAAVRLQIQSSKMGVLHINIIYI